jgi:hypothetical protein
MSQVQTGILKLPEVTGTFAIAGFSFSGTTANSGVFLVPSNLGMNGKSLISLSKP